MQEEAINPNRNTKPYNPLYDFFEKGTTAYELIRLECGMCGKITETIRNKNELYVCANHECGRILFLHKIDLAENDTNFNEWIDKSFIKQRVEKTTNDFNTVINKIDDLKDELDRIRSYEMKKYQSQERKVREDLIK